MYAIEVRPTLYNSMAVAPVFVGWEKAESVVLPKLKPSTKTISLRISASMLDKIRLVANNAAPYHSLIKSFLQERIDEELKLSKV